tara:strand:+ start:328 stop:1044 length:717 start_codon:yes stop_codon:yes gene_type:complete
MTINRIHTQEISPTFIVEGISASPPVSSLGSNQQWLVTATATGDWAGQENNIATFSGRGVWLFHTPLPQQTVYDKTNAIYWMWNNDEWDVDSSFDSLGTSTAIPSSHLAVSKDIITPSFLHTLETGAPSSAYRFSTAAGVTGSYSLTVANPIIITDVAIYQTVAAGAGACTVDILTDGAAPLFPTMVCDTVNPGILRPVTTVSGAPVIAAGGLIDIIATDAAGGLPPMTVIINFILGS